MQVRSGSHLGRTPVSPVVCLALQLVLLSVACTEPEAVPVRPNVAAQPAAATLANWPPQVGKPYPDFEFRDLEGQPVRLSSFKGKVLLIEPIGMNCPACNAFSGANREGMRGFRDVRPQGGLQSIEEYLPIYGGGVRIDDPNLVFVHLLLYNFEMKAPTQVDAGTWVEHFGLDRLPNYRALAADRRFLNAASYNMIPGFQLVDQDLILRVDATGHRPHHDLYRDLLPLLGDLVRQGSERNS